METKDQLNQNPAEDTNPKQDENSKSETKDLQIEENKANPEAEKKSHKEEVISKKDKVNIEPKTETLEEKTESIPPEEAADIEEPKPQVEETKPKDKEEALKVDEKVAKVEEPKLQTKETKTEEKEEVLKVDEKVAKVEEPKVKTEEIIKGAEEDKFSGISKEESELSKEVLEDHDNEDHDNEDHEEEEDNGEDHKEQINYDTLTIEELVDALEEIVKEGEVEKIKKKVALIKVAFIKLNKERQEKRFEEFVADGGDKENYSPERDNLELRYQGAFQIYHEKRKQHIEDLEKQKQDNLEAKKLVLVELKALIESEESLKKTYDEFKDLQEKWKNIGLVPKNEVNNLWQNYHFYVEKFFDKVKINKELRDLDLKKNLELKIELCEKAEELLLETSILKSFKQLQQLHQEWKEIGPVIQDKKDEIWERFKTTTDKINERRREHYNSLRDEQKQNLEAKTALCEKAEELLQIENNSIKDWQENTEKISELLKVWKTIGQAPRQQNDEIWERFKTSLDTFFAGKKEYFQQLKDEQMNNYNLKLDLCAQAEAIKGNTDWRKTTQELINLQKEWKKIGPVPKKHSDKIWKRFRAACDEFFNNKSEYFGNIKQHESDNLKQKEELIKKVEGFKFGTDKNENLDVLKGFQREWTEIGHVPFKEKDRMQNAFRDAINRHFDKLKISRIEAQAENYKHRFENIKDNPNANRILYNERNFLVQKRKKLEDEIILLENNMGFFAQSKKADLLKLELGKKIEKARNEISLINEKIKFLEREAE